jgi:tetratricopeptide (TPR) repeat protein
MKHRECRTLPNSLRRWPRLCRGIMIGLCAGAGACATGKSTTAGAAAADVAMTAPKLTAAPTTTAPDPWSGAGLFAEGLAAKAAGDVARAEQYFAAALERGYPIAEVMPALLSASIGADRFDSALYYAHAHLINNPKDVALRYLVASLHLAVGQNARAREQLELLTEVSPQHPQAHYLLAILARDDRHDASNARRAAQEFTRYLALAPDGRHAAEARSFINRHKRGLR